MNKRIFSIFTGIIITTGLFAILFSQIELNDVFEILKKIQPIYLVAGFIFYAACFFLRALRLHFLLNREISVKELFSIVCIHTMALNVLPARSGELSYIYLLKKLHKRTAGEGAASLITIRIMDIITISLFFFLSIILTHDLPPIVMNAIKIIGIFLVFIILFILIFIWNCSRFVYAMRNISIYLKVNEKKSFYYIFNKLDEMSDTFNKLTRKLFIQSMIISFSIWILLYFGIYAQLEAMGISVVLAPFLLASTFFLMTSIIPIQGIGGFGTLEGGWALSFMAVGVAKDVAISSGIIMHIISIIYLILLFLIGYVGLKERQISDN